MLASVIAGSERIRYYYDFLVYYNDLFACFCLSVGPHRHVCIVNWCTGCDLEQRLPIDHPINFTQALSDACDVLAHALPRPTHLRKGEKQRMATARRCCLEASLLLFRVLANLHTLHQEQDEVPRPAAHHPSNAPGIDGSINGSGCINALGGDVNDVGQGSDLAAGPHSRIAVMLAHGSVPATQHVLNNLDAHCGFVAPLVESASVRARVTWVCDGDRPLLVKMGPCW